MKNSVPEKLLQKYLQGDCTPDELAIVHKWYNSYNDETDLFSALSENEQNTLKSRLLGGIREKIRIEENSQNTFQVKRKKST
ncbi:MAG: hypothetical protein JWQ25_2877, partial [Daejeonella sp.]|nr:hypothetical protein [Daejeonella sp.]